jgi:hypothetical protein
MDRTRLERVVVELRRIPRKLVVGCLVRVVSYLVRVSARAVRSLIEKPGEQDRAAAAVSGRIPAHPGIGGLLTQTYNRDIRAGTRLYQVALLNGIQEWFSDPDNPMLVPLSQMAASILSKGLTVQHAQIQMFANVLLLGMEAERLGGLVAACETEASAMASAETPTAVVMPLPAGSPGDGATHPG